eukprot:3702905-Pyramimonas_sp.AAC.1
MQRTTWVHRGIIAMICAMTSACNFIPFSINDRALMLKARLAHARTSTGPRSMQDHRQPFGIRLPRCKPDEG